MAQVITNGPGVEYAEIVRRLEVIGNQEEFTQERVSLQQRLKELEEQITSGYVKADAPTPVEEKVLSDLDRIKGEIKEAMYHIKMIRRENKELHYALKQNVAEKRKYNYEIIPSLRKQKQEILNKLGTPRE